MKNMKNNKHSFLVGILTMLLVICLATPSLASLAEKTIQVLTGVDVFVDGVEMDFTDANGNPAEPFVYNGTTYVPVRAISQSLGKNVNWDGENKRVYIGKQPGENQDLLDVCPPFGYSEYDFKTPSSVEIMGNSYRKGLQFTGHHGDFDRNVYSWAYFNLNGQYTSFDFDVGHVDGSALEQATCQIMLDGKIAVSFDLSGDMSLTHYTLPLDGAGTMAIHIVGESDDALYGFVNATLQ